MPKHKVSDAQRIAAVKQQRADVRAGLVERGLDTKRFDRWWPKSRQVENTRQSQKK